ncbi:MAG: hypothetical protein K6A36_06985 [Paludibacteraceae bacterium]|nr:hypothetical protein [Paludibacteraceae bacterium]
MIRVLIDKIFRAGIKLCMLTGVAFTVTACYGVPPERREHWYPNEPDYENAQQKVEKQLQQAAQSEDAFADEASK